MEVTPTGILPGPGTPPVKKMFPHFRTLILVVLGAAACFQAASAETVSQSLLTSAGHGGGIKAIPFDQIGAQAQKQYQGDGIAILPSPTGAFLRAATQDLEAHAGSDGLWLTSRSDEDGGKANRFQLRAMEVGRGGVKSWRATADGVVQLVGETAAFVRPGITEEYSVSVDGVRQDFLVMERPSGADGELNVVVEVSGAKAEAADYGVKLTVEATGRELAYTRLKVMDALGRELKAHMQVESAHSVRVVVDDAGAAYPVRVDPFFSDADWVSMGTGLSGVTGTVNAIAIDSAGVIYLGGDFVTSASGVELNRITKWTGSGWAPLKVGTGGTAGVSGTVTALAAVGTTLYVAGNFSQAGDVAANGVAKWSGTAWSAVGEGVSGGFVNAMAVVSATNICVGGLFMVGEDLVLCHVARWNGSVWLPIGDLGVGSVQTMVASGTTVYIGGTFGSVDVDGSGPIEAVEASNIARWNGSSWAALGAGVGDPGASSVNAIAVSGGTVYAGGAFSTAGVVPANNIAVWNSSSWAALGGGVQSEVLALALGSGGLYVGGNLSSADGDISEGGKVVSHVARWSGGTWSDVGGGTDGKVLALLASGTVVYAGGEFIQAGGGDAKGVARWSGSSWSGMATGLNGPVTSLAVSGTNVYLGGSFTAAGTVTANNVVRWTGSAWAALGDGVNDEVRALTMIGTQLYAGGLFSSAGGTPASRVARWDGSTWHALQEGLNGPVYALASTGSTLYVGGTFSTAGPNTANNAARWDGVAWSALGTGLGDTGTVVVSSLLVSGTDVFAGGSFSTADGSPASNVARWNGTAWSALGAGLNDDVLALALVGNVLHAGGSFTQSGATAVAHVGRWDGTNWSTLGAGLDNTVHALVSVGSSLYAGGEFTAAGAESVNHVARWDGRAWTTLGSGADETVFALVLGGNTLYIGGEFASAGGKPSTFAARAGVAFPTIAINSQAILGPASVSVQGTLNPQGSGTLLEIEYGLTTDYLMKATIAPASHTGSAAKTVTATLSGLSAGVQYHYRLKATNTVGVSYSEGRTFFIPEGTLAIDAPAGSTIVVLENEPTDQVKIPITRSSSGGFAGAVSVVLNTVNGTAFSGSDYTGQTNAAVTLVDGQDFLEFPIGIIESGASEPNETFTVKLTGSFVTPGGTNSVTVRIIDMVSLTNASPAPNGDQSPPKTPVISFPAKNALVGADAGGTVTITGTVLDDRGVESVEARLVGPGGPPSGWSLGTLGSRGAPSTSFSVNVTPATGYNKVEVRATDFATNVSAVYATQEFRVARPLPVLVSAAGSGSVTAGFMNPTSYREVGKSITINAIAKTASGIDPGSIFTGWTLGGTDVAVGGSLSNADAARIGTTVAGLSKNALTFIFREGMTLTANFSTNTYPAKSGTYNGLVRTLTIEDGTSANSTEGYFNADVMSSGAFSGKLTIDGLVLNVSGLFDDAGVARFGTARTDSVVVARTGKPSLKVALTASSGAPFRIIGTVTQTAFQQSKIVGTSTVTANRAYYGKQVLPGRILSKTATETTLQLASAAGRSEGEVVTGTGILAGSLITAVNLPDQIVIGKVATGAINAVPSLTFTRDVPNNYLTVNPSTSAKSNGAFNAILPPKAPYYQQSGSFYEVGTWAPGSYFDPGSATEFREGDYIRFSGGGLPDPLSTAQTYRVFNKEPNGTRFQIRDGSSNTIVLTEDGSGTVSREPANSQAAADAGYRSVDYPQGYGYGTVTVTPAGLVTVATTLADGTAATASSTISQPVVSGPAEDQHDGVVAVFVPLYNKLGFLSALVTLNDGEAESDMLAADAQWLRPAITTSHYFPAGWPTVISVGLKAARFSFSTGGNTLLASNGASLETDDLEGDGNAALIFGDGQLTESLLKNVLLTAANSVTTVVKVPDNDPTFTLKVAHKTGVFDGTFSHTDDTAPAFKGIIYQKGVNAGGYGYFLTKQPTVINYTGESGWVELIGEP